jgi:hypothetical protein
MSPSGGSSRKFERGERRRAEGPGSLMMTTVRALRLRDVALNQPAAAMASIAGWNVLRWLSEIGALPAFWPAAAWPASLAM